MRMLVAAERLGPGGGMERYLDVVLPELIARGVSVRVVARQVDGVPHGVDAEHVAWAEEHEISDRRAAHAVAAVAERFRPEITVAHNVMDGSVVAALRAAGHRFAYHVHDHRPFCPNGDRVFPRTGRNCTEPLGAPCALHALTDGCVYGPRPRTVGLIRRRSALRDAIATADVTIVASSYVAARAAESGIARERIVVLRLPLPDDAYAEAAALAGERSVLFAARIVPQKGLASLVRAIAHLPAAQRPLVRVLGDGPALEDARAEARQRAIPFEAAGAFGAAAVRAAIDAARLVAVPSLWAEPFGYVGIEAFARGRTVVAYDVGGIPAWLRDGENGFAVRLGDEPAFGAAVTRVLDDAALRARLESGARKDAERYRARGVVDELLTAYAGRA